MYAPLNFHSDHGGGTIHPKLNPKTIAKTCWQSGVCLFSGAVFSVNNMDTHTHKDLHTHSYVYKNDGCTVYMIHVNFMLCDTQSSLFHGRLLSVGMHQYDQYIQYSLQLKKLNTSRLFVWLYARATWNSNRRRLWSSSVLVGNFRKISLGSSPGKQHPPHELPRLPSVLPQQCRVTYLSATQLIM